MDFDFTITDNTTALQVDTILDRFVAFAGPLGPEVELDMVRRCVLTPFRPETFVTLRRKIPGTTLTSELAALRCALRCVPVSTDDLLIPWRATLIAKILAHRGLDKFKVLISSRIPEIAPFSSHEASTISDAIRDSTRSCSAGGGLTELSLCNVTFRSTEGIAMIASAIGGEDDESSSSTLRSVHLELSNRRRRLDNAGNEDP